jgi:hypothetical protein
MTLPNFVVIGVAKAGTSSLHAYLRQHPEVFLPRMKDPAYFAYNGQFDHVRFRVRTLADYEALFAGAGSAKAIGDVTDTYFRARVAPANIRAAIPQARIIVSLREPVSRANSLYHMMMRNRGINADRSFLEALEQSPPIRAFYSDALEVWYDHFPRERIHVVLFDDLVGRGAETCRSLYEFVGVDPGFVPDLRVFNPGGVPKSLWLHRVMAHPRLRNWAQTNLPEAWVDRAKNLRSLNLDKNRMSLSAEEKAVAAAFFRDDVLKTQELTGVDLSRWLRNEAQAAPAA